MDQKILLGYVAGVIVNGLEWLYNARGDWCSLDNRSRHSDPRLFRSAEAAHAWLTVHGSRQFPTLVRPYYRSVRRKGQEEC